MSKSASTSLHLPHMRANPFSVKPIEPSDFELLVGRSMLMADLRQHLRFGSPRLMILLGERGSGRTSVLQALSNLSSTSYPFTFYPEQNPAQTLLNEMYCRIAGYNTPSSTNTLVEELVAKLQGFSGDLPLISFDFPGVAGAELAQVFERLSPVLGRLRGLIIVALTPAQLSAWPENLQIQFDITEPLSDFDAKTARILIDHRIRKVSNEAWPISQSVLDQSIAQTGGRPALLVRHLRDLIDAERGASTSFSRKNDIVEAMNLEPNDAKTRMSPTVEPLEPLDSESEDNNESEIEFDWDVPEMELEVEQAFPDEPIQQEIGAKESEPEFELPAFEVEGEPSDDENLSGGVILQMEPGTEPPPASQPAFTGLAQRHRAASMEIGLEKSFRPKSSGPLEAKPDPTMRMPEEVPQHESEEATYWVADSLPEPEPSPEPTLMLGPEVAKTIGESLRKDKPKVASSSLPLNFERVSALSDAEISIVEAAISREVSPSDAALQAYLSVGRPRLSQIFNGLHKAGILSVRKKGRTRLFRISDQAKAHFSDGHMEA